MSTCTIFKKSLYKDIVNFNEFSIKTDWINGLIPSYNEATSGVWLPVIIDKDSSSNITFVEPFIRADPEVEPFSPCSCVPETGVLQYTPDDEDAILNCSYCLPNNSHGFTWNLTDNKTGKSSPSIYSNCCNGACDYRLTKDDYLVKLPTLNNSYLTKFYDWKYKAQFPACSNYGLGYENFASIDGTRLGSFSTSSSFKLVIDWKIKERLSEIPPNDIDTYHKDIDTHEKSYNRSLINSKTCGNFILTNLNSSDTSNPTYSIFDNLIGSVPQTGDYSSLLPSVSNFTKPYGFKNQDYYNIFVKTQKLGSYWKWNYNSGILCWYRYYDKDRLNDDRFIKGVDLYISEGDVFFATNDGPEDLSNGNANLSPGDYQIKSCPSGLKLIKDNSVTGIIPSGSDFIYISENLYNKTYSIINKLTELEAQLQIPTNDRTGPINKLHLASLLATGPNYHEVTTDLLKAVVTVDNVDDDYSRDTYKQITLFNKAMLFKSQHKENKLNIVKTKEDLLNTLANKYGCYIWCPPQSSISLKLKKNIDPHCYIDIDFEPVVKLSDTTFSRRCSVPRDCLEATIQKDFTYSQQFKVGNLSFKTTVDKRFKNTSCNSGNFTIDKAANITSAYFNDKLVKQESYGSGCTIYYQKYPRAPSYDLALKAIGEGLCSTYQLCNKTLAFKYNNDNNLWGKNGELSEGSFEDKSLILNRRYPANIGNTNIDRLGFHRDGGVYYDSNNLGSGNVIFINGAQGTVGTCDISFDTKDFGIKIYDISIFKLRDRSNSECKTFPLDQACKCFPLSSVTGYKYNCDGSLTYSNTNAILYTPNLSTQSSPDIKAYGGYSNDNLNNIIGSKRILNHPVPDSIIPAVSKIIDPLNPYECSKEISISLPNFIYNKWKLILSRYSNIHSDIWAKVQENTDLFNPTIPDYYYDGENEDFGVLDNPSYRRYMTKVILNNTNTIFNKQQKILFTNQSTNGTIVDRQIDIEFKNPFLVALLQQAGYNFEKSPYTNLLCSLDTSSFDNRLININLTFKQVPRKQVLNFKLEPIVSLGNLGSAFFHPNSGLSSSTSNQTSLVYYSGNCSIDFDYEKLKFGTNNSNNTSYSSDGFMLSGAITDKMMRVLEWNNSLLSHNKLRLYLNYNNKWYEYLNPHIFGFFNKFNDIVYPGYPYFFEYADKDTYKSFNHITQKASELVTINSKNKNNPNPPITFPSQLIPVSAKNNTKFSFIKNIMPTGNLETFSSLLYPTILGKFERHPVSSSGIILKGSRPYYLLKEKDIAVILDSKTIPNMDNDQMDLVSRKMFVIESNGNRWKYKGSGSLTDYNSYSKIDSRNYRDHNFSDLWIDENNIGNNGYVIDSNRTIDGDKQIKLAYFDKETNTKQELSFKITEKSLYAKYIDKFGNPPDTESPIKKNYARDISTRLTVQLNGDDIPLKGLAKIDTKSLVIFQNFEESVKRETDTRLVNRFYQYDTKWGDLINFDNRIINDINNSRHFIQLLKTSYPQSTYDNLLYKITVNNLETGNFIYVSGTGDNYSTVRETGSIYYNIHQKYNIGLEEICPNSYSDYNNYLPFIDINLVDQTQKGGDDASLDDDSKPPQTGAIYISGIRSFTPKEKLYTNPDSGSIFFLSLNNSGQLRPILFDKSFYYDTLRVDDVYFRLLSVSKQSSRTTSGCTTIFEPNTNFREQSFNDYFNTQGFDSSSEKITTVFNTLPIYCDSDVPAALCGNQSCSIKTVGFTKLKADYQNYQYSFINASKLKNQQVQFALSVDEGLYNGISNDSLPYIQRFEIPPNSNLPKNTLDGTDSCMPDIDSRPSRPLTYIDKEYQDQLENYILSPNDKGELVKNTDILANEMLFRLMYGSKQKISRETIKKKTVLDLIKDNSEKSLSYLVQYSDPRTTADRLYDLIPYDYSTSSDSSKRKINGSISIDGVLTVGSTTSITIGGYNISITISNIENKICAVASCNGKSYTSQIFDTRPRSSTITAVPVGTQVYSPSQNSRVNFLSTCRGGIQSRYWLKGKYFTSMTITPQDPNFPPVDVVAKYKDCVAKMDNFGCSPAPHDSVMSYHTLPNLGGALCPPLCTSCNSRGWAEGPSVPGDCTVLTSTNKGVKMGGVSRGLFGFRACAVANVGVSITPALRDGDLDAYMGGLVIRRHSSEPNCNYSSTCKGNCMPLDSEDEFGKIFDPKRYFGSSVSAPCECQNYSTGYCTLTENSCQCKEFAQSYPKVFTYEFQNCNYSFSNMKGHIAKFKDGETVKFNGSSQQFGCGRMDSIGIGYQGGSANEECYWLECYGPMPHDWDIYEIVSTSSQEYRPDCPVWLCTITYDNNKANISMIGGKTGCFDITLRNNCPEISITLPNDKFSFSDSINSECTMCDVEKNIVQMDPAIQHPNWDIVTERRTAVLGYLPIEGDRNKDVMAGGGSSSSEYNLCDIGGAGCCYDQCFYHVGAFLQCGESAPNSWPWRHALRCHLKESPEPSFTPCITMSSWNNGTFGTIVGNVLGEVNFAVGSDNPTAKQSHISYWKELMEAAYYDVSACHNNYGTFNVDDLVEGVVPGSCTSLKYEVLSYPIVAFRQTLNGGVSQPGYLGVHVAYYQYDYKRPRSIQDIFLGDNDIKCSTILSQAAPSSYNITEKYTVKDCESTPSCFDTSISRCTSGNICCEQNLSSRP